MVNYKIEVSKPPGEVMIALSIIERFQKKNNTNYKINIKFDYTMELSAGEYDEDTPNIIYINPDNCLPDESNISLGAPEDASIFGTVMHEFAHLILLGKRSDIKQEYLKEFNVERLWINDYCEVDVDEEMAEVFRLFLVNPFLLKLISPEGYKFFKKHFKSPTTCSQKHSVSMYEDWGWSTKESLSEVFGIKHDVYLNKLVQKQ